MAGRIRTIKPELLEDELAAGLSDAAWRLFVSSWLLADDQGNFRAAPRYLAAQVWQDSARDALGPLLELADLGRVLLYEVGGQLYGNVPTWSRHQRIDNAGKPKNPAPPANIRALSSSLAASLRESPRVSAVRGLIWNGKEEDQEGTKKADSSGPGGPGSSPKAAEGPPDEATPPPPSGGPPTPPKVDNGSAQGTLALAPVEPPAPAPQTPADRVFARYLDGWRRVVAAKRPPALDRSRRRLVEKRMSEGFTEEDLLQAVDGMWVHGWSIKTHNWQFEIALRDRPHVEKFMYSATHPTPEDASEAGGVRPSRRQPPPAPGAVKHYRDQTGLEILDDPA